MLRPPKAAAPLRRRCLSCFDRFTGGMSAPLPPPEYPPTPPGPFPGPGRSLADGPSPTPTGNRCFRGRYNRRADRSGRAEAIRPNRPGRNGRTEFESVPERPLAGLSSHGNRPFRSKAYIYLTMVFQTAIKHPHRRRARPAANVCYFGGGECGFFSQNRRGTSPREIDPPAPFSGGFSFSEQNAGGALGDLYGTIFSQAEARGKPFMGFPLAFLFSQTLQTLRSFAHPLSPADDSGSSRRRRRSACSTQSRRSGRNPVPGTAART